MPDEHLPYFPAAPSVQNLGEPSESRESTNPGPPTPHGFARLAAQAASAVATQEQPLALDKADGSLRIGVPKEKNFQENRVSLTPEAVALLVGRGHDVVLESKAGAASFFTDRDYSEAGAQIVYAAENVYQDTDIIVKVGPVPHEELAYLKPRQFLISAIHLSTLTGEHLAELQKRQVVALAFEYLRDAEGSFPIVRSMSEIAGTSALLLAAEYLSNQFHGNGVLLGGITGLPPSKVVILGAGTVGEFAARTALGLGAEVRIFDNSLSKLRRVQISLGHRVFASVLQPETLARELRYADVAIGAIHSRTGRTPMIVTEAMVQQMKPGAVIVDVSIDQGGCFETSEVTTHNRPTVKKHGIIHYGVPNIPSRVAKTASISLSNILVPMLLDAGQRGGMEESLWHDEGLRAAVYAFNGGVTNRHLAQRFQQHYTDLELIAAARG